MATTLAALRRRINALPRGPQRRYPRVLQQQILAFISSSTLHDTDERTCVRQLGLNWLTVSRWREAHCQHEERSEPPRLRPVVITESHDDGEHDQLRNLPDPPVPDSAAGLSLAAPGGFRVDGLDEGQALRLLLGLVAAQRRQS